MEAEFRQYADCNVLVFVTERTAPQEENRTVERLGERGLQWERSLRMRGTKLGIRKKENKATTKSLAMQVWKTLPASNWRKICERMSTLIA